MDDVLTIDGSEGEGGGQILRTSLSLSAITGKEIAIKKIRAGRAKPGLKRQHLTCVKAVAEICGAKVSEVDVDSMELTFAPGPIKGGDYRFDVGTAGSVTLVAQTVVPVLLKADKPSTVTITGGTHVPYAPVWEFFTEAYLPELRRMGARVEAELVQPGFYPAAGGVVKIRVWPFEEEAKDGGGEVCADRSRRISRRQGRGVCFPSPRVDRRGRGRDCRQASSGFEPEGRSARG